MELSASMTATEHLLQCKACKESIEPGKEYFHHKKVLCEECYMNVRMVYRRKTHWQYIRSIKTKYIITG